MSNDTYEYWPEDTDKPFTCSCGGEPTIILVGTAGGEDKRQVICTVCGTCGPRNSEKAAAVNQWNIQVEALTTHRTVPEIIRNRVEIAKAAQEADNE